MFFGEPAVDKDVLMHHMTERFQELYTQALESLDQASEGRWIAESEWAFRDVFQQLMRESYQAALQSKIDAHPCEPGGSFSPSGAGGRADADDQRIDRVSPGGSRPGAQQGSNRGAGADGGRRG